MDADARQRQRRRRPRGAVAAGAALCLPLLAWAPAHAQDAADIAHRVQPGDTLIALSLHYLGDARAWPQLQRINRVGDPRRLVPGSVLTIPARLLPASSAQVLFATGNARLTPPGSAAPQPASAGQTVPEGARLQAAEGGFISVRLADGTVVRIHADSDVQVRQLRRRGRAGDAQSIWQLHRGSVEPSVPPSGDGARRFEIRTPGASTAVRGTRFTVALAPDGRTLAAVTEGSVAVAPAAQAPRQAGETLAGGQGLAVSADGRVGARRPLLPPPGLAAIPAALGDADFLRLPLAPVAGAAAYLVQVARDADFTAIVHSQVSPSAQVQLAALDDGRYHLSARAIDAEGLPGQPAQRGITVKAHPIAPLLQAPAAGAVMARGAGELSCTEVTGAVRYRIQVARAEGFAAPVLDETRTGRCALAVAALAPGAYQWRAASLRELPGGALDQGPFGDAQPFVVAQAPDAPAAGDIEVEDTGATLRLRWPGHAGGHYRLQVSAAADFEPLLVDQELAEPAWSANRLAPGRYHLRIRTLDASGLASSFSTPRQFVLPQRSAVRSGFGLPVVSGDGQPLAQP